MENKKCDGVRQTLEAEAEKEVQAKHPNKFLSVSRFNSCCVDFYLHGKGGSEKYPDIAYGFGRPQTFLFQEAHRPEAIKKRRLCGLFHRYVVYSKLSSL